MQLRTILLCSILINAFFYAAHGQVKSISVSPPETGAAISSVHGNHVAYIDTRIKPLNQLLLMIVGTDAAADHNIPFFQFAASLGYHVISLDYKNTVISTVCSSSEDSTCFDNFRQEIIFGDPVSPLVAVDSANSIYHRFYQLLLYLGRNYPGQGWQQYLENKVVKWNMVTVAGHSQGAGHVAYLAKIFPVRRVLIFAGPQDFMVHFNSPARWLWQTGVTNSSKFFAFLHVKDPYDFNKQRADCVALMPGIMADTVMVQPGTSITKGRHILVTGIETKNPHEAMMQPVFEKAWAYLLSADPAR